MDRDELLKFLRRHKLAVQATTSATNGPQAAVVGIAVTDAFEIVFDTMDVTRKIINLRSNPKIALVIGWDNDRTVQLEGIADEPTGDELNRAKIAYFNAHPDGPTREIWPGITYVRVVPTWIRDSDFSVNPARIVEYSRDELAAMGVGQRTKR